VLLETVHIVWHQLGHQWGYSFPILRLCKWIWHVRDSTQRSGSPTSSKLHEVRSIHLDVLLYADYTYSVCSATGLKPLMFR
jgi:hypothetical protein